MGCLTLKFATKPNSRFQPKVIFDLNAPTERPCFKHSENHEIIEIGSPELKLWPFSEIGHLYSHVILLSLPSHTPHTHYAHTHTTPTQARRTERSVTVEGRVR